MVSVCGVVEKGIVLLQLVCYLTLEFLELELCDDDALAFKLIFCGAWGSRMVDTVACHFACNEKNLEVLECNKRG